MAYLCPNMINYDAVDFSECRSEEVISFMCCSVGMWYLLLNTVCVCTHISIYMYAVKKPKIMFL